MYFISMKECTVGSKKHPICENVSTVLSLIVEPLKYVRCKKQGFLALERELAQFNFAFSTTTNTKTRH